MNPRLACSIGASLAVAVSGPTARGDDTLRISNAPNGAAGDASSYIPEVSRDGSVVVFISDATDLVPNDTNGVSDVFVYVRATGVIERVSVSSNGSQADGTSQSGSPHLSADGRYVAFASGATNLDANDDGTGILDVFVRDRVAGTTHRISSNAQGASGNGSSVQASITPDGRFVVYHSVASDLVSGDTNGALDIFRYDATTGATVLVSVDGAGNQGYGDSFIPFISDDGATVAFSSRSTNFPDFCSPSWPPGLNSFRKSLATGTLERVDVDWTGAFPCADSSVSGISADGNVVLFGGSAAYVADDTNDRSDGHLRDFSNGALERVTVKTGGVQFDTDPWYYGSFGTAMSSDARFVVFEQWLDGSPLDHQHAEPDGFLRDRATGVTSIITIGAHDEPADGTWGNAGNVSDDGTCVVFDNNATSFAPNDGNRDQDVFLRLRSLTPATQIHYGAGFPGRNGVVPTLAARNPPWRGSTLELDLTNSSDLYVTAFVFAGLAREDVPTPLGGDLLVDPFVIIPVPLIPSGGTLTGVVPSDVWADGLLVDLQALELDPWALHGVSFTDGLELTLGDG
jgi:Tol biopolymer transport system component